MIQHHLEHLWGAGGGMTLTMVVLPTGTTVLATIILAAVGGSVGFFVSKFLGIVWDKLFKKEQ